jgi:ATP-dependent DNA helicase RecQ
MYQKPWGQIRNYLCLYPKKVENLYFFLRNKGVPAAMYHAGLTAEQRNRQQDSFINGEARVIAATNAFGMGIDKSDVRYIIHYNMPISMESYYQEPAVQEGTGKELSAYY